MASNEGHIHWSGSPDETINYLGQDLQLTAEVSNKIIVKEDPEGTVRIGLVGSGGKGLALPTEGWEAIPGTNPILEARQDGHCPSTYIRIRQQ